MALFGLLKREYDEKYDRKYWVNRKGGLIEPWDAVQFMVIIFLMFGVAWILSEFWEKLLGIK